VVSAHVGGESSVLVAPPFARRLVLLEPPFLSSALVESLHELGEPFLPPSLTQEGILPRATSSAFQTGGTASERTMKAGTPTMAKAEIRTMVKNGVNENGGDVVNVVEVQRRCVLR